MTGVAPILNECTRQHFTYKTVRPTSFEKASQTSKECRRFTSRM